MIPVSQGKPYAGNPHVRFEEGASAQAAPRRSALLHRIRVMAVVFCCMLTALFVMAIANMGGGINMSNVATEFARFADCDLSKKIVEQDINIDVRELVRMSFNNISREAMTVLMLHPLFPQERRNELIIQGMDGFYLDNATLRNTITTEDARAFIKSDFVTESELDQLLECGICNDEMRTLVMERKQRLLSYRLRRRINNLLGRGTD